MVWHSITFERDPRNYFIPHYRAFNIDCHCFESKYLIPISNNLPSSAGLDYSCSFAPRKMLSFNYYIFSYVSQWLWLNNRLEHENITLAQS